MLLHPRFDENEINVVRAETLNSLKRREDSLSQQAFELFAETLHPEHPYRFRTLGTPKTINSIDRKALRAYYDQYVHPRNAVLAVVGDVDPERLLRSLEVYLADWKKPGTVALPARGPSFKPGKHEASITKNKEQVHVVIGFPGIALADPDAPALDVLTQLLSGQAGRLFLELRDRKSLAYTVSAFTIAGVDPGSWGVYIASAPDKLTQSLDGLNAELQRVLDNPIGDDELERARNYLIGSQAVSFQRLSMQASAFALDELYGLGARHSLEYPQRIAAVTRADVERVARRIIQLETPIVAIVK
jgi:zinc protease